ncbi:MAG TPA: hypothetical protein VN668_10455 [Stellaceae bacterium]|nr:hypothetical protein [Stellaceae bacterium]
MASKKEKVLTYRRAEWVLHEDQAPVSGTLTGFIKQAMNKLPDVPSRTLTRSNGQTIKLASAKTDAKGGLYLHIVADTPGEAASVVPKAKGPAVEIQVGTTAPPPDADFLDGDGFVYARDNDVCLCGTAMQDTTVRYFLHQFFWKAGLPRIASQFDLMKVANITAVKLLQKQGVKQIELRSTLYQASANYHRRRAHPQGLLGALSKHLRAVAGNEHDVNNDALRIELTLKTDKRRTSGIKLGEKRIKALAIETIQNQEGDDDFVIVTKADQRIGPDEINMRTKVQIDSDGKTVNRDKAWEALFHFFNTLDEAGALEE